MTNLRSEQLSKMQSLHMLRQRDALAKVREQQKCVEVLKSKANEIQSCVNVLLDQLSELDDERLGASNITVAMLHEEAAHRAIVERDLRKERFYLETATKDVSEAKDELARRQSRWREHSQRLEGLTEISKKEEKLANEQVQRRIDRELDNLALTHHGSC